MIIDNFFSSEINDKILNRTKKALSFIEWKKYYTDFLLSETLKFFTWECGDIPQKEIEMRLAVLGKCGINRLKDGSMVACDIAMNGITNYYDEFTHYNYTTPKESGQKTIGVDGVVISNNALRIPFIYIIDRYAMTLAHIHVTMLCSVINLRSGSIAVCHDTKQAEGFKEYRKKLYNGNVEALVDRDFLGIDIKQNGNTSGQLSPMEMHELLNDTLMCFYRDMGIPNVHVKKERMLTNEIEYENVLPKLNIKDAYDSRVKACEEINRVFGTNWSVKCNINFEEKGENENENENDGVIQPDNRRDTV